MCHVFMRLSKLLSYKTTSGGEARYSVSSDTRRSTKSVSETHTQIPATRLKGQLGSVLYTLVPGVDLIGRPRRPRYT